MGYHGATTPLDEEQRQAAVERSGILRRSRDAGLQAIVERAAAKFGTAIAAISILDRQRQWFAAGVGLTTTETPRSWSICADAIHRPGEVLVVPDARQDSRFAGNPLVTGVPWIRFYAGKPLVSPDGYPLGTLCVVDPRPRFSTPDLYELTLLASRAERIINSHR